MTHRRDTTRGHRRTGGFACVMSLVAMTACQHPSVEEVATTAAVPVLVEAARVGVLQGVIAVTGVVTAAPGAEMVVVAPAPARIAELPHAEGDRVKKGDLLVRFDIPTLTADVAASRAKVTQAVARVEAARANVKRLTSLLAQGVAAPRDVEDATRQLAEAEGDLEQARSAVEAADALSGRAVVRAPFSGVVAQRFHNPGDLVEAASSDPVLKVLDPSQLQVVAAVPASELSRIVVGHAADVRQAGHGEDDEGEAAKVLVKAPQVDPATATGNVRLGFAKPTSLTAGMTVQVEIVAEERPNALIIPVAALVDDEGELFVMVAGDDNKAHKYPVAVGLSTRTLVEVTSGIKAGDRVIVRGQDGVPEGATVVVESK
jgi:RND family efflux transporter MFP subunit